MPIRSTLSVIFAVIVPVLMGCSKSSVTDEVDAKLANIHAASTPLPVKKTTEMTENLAVYDAKNDPFMSPFGMNNADNKAQKNQEKSVQSNDKSTNNDNAQKKDTATPTTANNPVYYGKKVAVNLNRPRQTLERYPLEGLKYQGRIEQNGRLTAFVLSPDGVAHPVRVGQYIGQNQGRITQVGHDEISITEAVLQADGAYYERAARLRFVE